MINRHTVQCRTRRSYFHILQYVQVSSGLNHYFLSYRVHTHTNTHTQTHTDNGPGYGAPHTTRWLLQLCIAF